MNQFKYPIGKFELPSTFTNEQKQYYIDQINLLPENIKEIIKALNESDYEYPYRPDGWNIRQVIHHLCDSHINAYIRFKLALTEDNPTIKPYEEDAFVRLSDSSYELIYSAISILEGIHKKWVVLLQNMEEADFDKSYYHPESGRTWLLKDVLALYAWHSLHHLAHIRQAIMLKGAF
ncbi:MAG TPA: putative metal-dependent hydrolase [Saprospiraceae bacterium]|nr:putative metal-dependent hydrolase [Saprospiraceae bacterium]